MGFTEVSSCSSRAAAWSRGSFSSTKPPGRAHCPCRGQQSGRSQMTQCSTGSTAELVTAIASRQFGLFCSTTPRAPAFLSTVICLRQPSLKPVGHTGAGMVTEPPGKSTSELRPAALGKMSVCKKPAAQGELSVYRLHPIGPPAGWQCLPPGLQGPLPVHHMVPALCSPAPPGTGHFQCSKACSVCRGDKLHGQETWSRPVTARLQFTWQGGFLRWMSSTFGGCCFATITASTVIPGRGSARHTA